ncbi:MAG TPA: gliding motility-associated C-terminal domain-containing protein [Catalimonadaceae bacterium]|nr:gliding motility-associated C-terminal domain-containing protein [Catalimonadaceae bacterium]
MNRVILLLSLSYLLLKQFMPNQNILICRSLRLLLALILLPVAQISAAYLNRPELVDYNFASANICEKASLKIKFDHEQFNPGNVFTVEISQNGSFQTGNTIQLVGALTQSGNQQNVFLTVTFPSSVPAGSNYRLRIKGSSPLTYSNQLNEFPFSISKLSPSDPTVFPTDHWRGSFYSWIPSTTGVITDGNLEDLFNTNNYLGYITEDSLSFDYNWGNNTPAPAIFPDTNKVCGSYKDFFSIRMQRKINFEEGFYIFGGGADDGFRLSLDGGLTWLISDWSDHAYRGSLNNNGCGVFITAGSRNVVAEFYENKTDARFRLVLIKTGTPVIDPISITSPANGATICSGSSPVQLTGNPAGAWQWSGPGVNYQGTLNPSVGGTGPRTITYQTGFSAFGQNCVKTASITVNIVNGLSAQFSGLQPAYCTNSPTVNLVPQNPGGTFSGPGVSGSTFSPLEAGPGSYFIQHILNTPGGCSDTVSIPVTVTAPIIPLIILPENLCSGAAPVTLVANAPGTFSGPGITGNQFNPALANIGNNTIVFTSVQGACTSISSGNIMVLNQPTVSLTLSSIGFCINQTRKAKINASPAGGTLTGPGITGDSLTVTGLTPGNYALQYIAGNAGCSDTAVATFTVYDLPDASFNNMPDTVCEGAANITLVPVTPGGAFVGQGVIPPNQFSPSILLVNNTYMVEYRVTKNGCFNRSEQFVNILDKLKPTLQFPTLKKRYCTTEPAFIPASIPPSRYYLNGNEVTSINPATLAPGNYQLLAVFKPATDLECIDTASARYDFTIIANPAPDLGPDKEVESGQSITLDPKVTAPYSWTTGEPGLNPEANKPLVFEPTVAQTIKVTASDPTLTCTGTDEMNLTVREKLFFPTLFTPNGDGYNNEWRITGGYNNMKISIIDRWGKKVYNGVSQGEIAWTGEGAEQSGLYFFLVEHPTDGRTWTGWVMVVRE